ncbi:hypothetical protein HZA45_01300 [Candidatus Peregrinibacteria bacterium]|nr:hypothetical protein [Candidatus Peregrinibacteria bacterium]
MNRLEKNIGAALENVTAISQTQSPVTFGIKDGRHAVRACLDFGLEDVSNLVRKLEKCFGNGETSHCAKQSVERKSKAILREASARQDILREATCFEWTEIDGPPVARRWILRQTRKQMRDRDRVMRTKKIKLTHNEIGTQDEVFRTVAAVYEWRIAEENGAEAFYDYMGSEKAVFLTEQLGDTYLCKKLFTGPLIFPAHSGAEEQAFLSEKLVAHVRSDFLHQLLSTAEVFANFSAMER